MQWLKKKSNQIYLLPLQLQTFILFNYVVMELDYDWLLEAYNLRIEECMYKWKRIKELEEENKNLRDYADNLDSENDNQAIEIEELKKENKNLKEFKEKRKESRFYFKAQMERTEPKTAREAEGLQRAKKLFEKLYREELSCLEEENRILKELIKGAQKILSN